MVAPKRMLLLIGSPRKKGTSYSFARTPEALAEEAGWLTETAQIYACFDGRQSLASLRVRMAEADLIGLVSPLYFDTIPGTTAWLFEQIHREGWTELKGKHLFAIGQSAYPFASLNEPLIESCRLFASAMAMEWLGGLGYGFGVMIDGAPLERFGRQGRRIIGALSMALGEWIAGRPVPAEAQERLMVRIPRLLYRPLALVMNLRTWLRGSRLGVDPAAKAYATTE